MSKALYATVGGVTHKSKKMYACKNGEVPVYGQTAVTEALSADNMSYAFSYANNSPLVWIIDDGQTSGELRITPGTNGASGNADILLTAKTTLTNVIVRNTSNESVARVNLTIRVNGVTLFDEAWDSSLTGQCWTGNLNAGDTLRFTVQATSQYSYTNYLYMSCDPFTRYTTTQTGTEIKPITRKIKKGYCVKGGVTHKFFGGELRYYGAATPLTRASMHCVAASNQSLAVIALVSYKISNGMAYPAETNVYDTNFTQIMTSQLTPRRYASGLTTKNYAMFGGGGQIDGDQADVLMYDTLLTQTITSSGLAQGGVEYPASAVAGQYAIFAGGLGTNDATKPQVTAYDIETLTRVIPSELPKAAFRQGGAANGERAVFAGGIYLTSNTSRPSEKLTNVCAYDGSLTKTIGSNLTNSSAGAQFGARAGNFAVFASGANSLVHAYDKNMVQTMPTGLAVTRTNIGSAAAEGFAIFAGGYGISGKAYTMFSNVDVYDGSLSKVQIDGLSVAREPAGTSFGDSAIFAGEAFSSQNFNYDTVDVYTVD